MTNQRELNLVEPQYAALPEPSQRVQGEERNWFGLTALITGLLGFFISVAIPFVLTILISIFFGPLWLFGVLFTIVSLVFTILGFIALSKKQATNKKTLIATAIINAIVLIYPLVKLVLTAIFVYNGIDALLD